MILNLQNPFAEAEGNFDYSAADKMTFVAFYLYGSLARKLKLLDSQSSSLEYTIDKGLSEKKETNVDDSFVTYI